MDGKGQTEVNIDANTRQWNLEPGAEYRFELDPGTSLAIKVSLIGGRMYRAAPACEIQQKKIQQLIRSVARVWTGGNFWCRASRGKHIFIWS